MGEAQDETVTPEMIDDGQRPQPKAGGAPPQEGRSAAGPSSVGEHPGPPPGASATSQGQHQVFQRSVRWSHHERVAFTLNQDAKEDQTRARHRLSKFLLRRNKVFLGKAWTKIHGRWLSELQFDMPRGDTARRTFEDAETEIGTGLG